MSQTLAHFIHELRTKCVYGKRYMGYGSQSMAAGRATAHGIRTIIAP